ncbi:MAG TPA: aldo/keto reductase, partial [Chroococcales cyanobacterium]
MEARKLGTEGLSVSCIGLGCMGMSQAYGTPEERVDAEAIKVIHRALELGVNFFDTAEVYGPFTNEQLVGRALKGRRQGVVVATKFGFEVTGSKPFEPNSHPARIKSVCDASLKRLGIDVIDLFYQHRVDPKIPIEEVAGTVGELISQGKVRFFGLSEAGPDTIKRAC